MVLEFEHCETAQLKAMEESGTSPPELLVDSFAAFALHDDRHEDNDQNNNNNTGPNDVQLSKDFEEQIIKKISFGMIIFLIFSDLTRLCVAIKLSIDF